MNHYNKYNIVGLMHSTVIFWTEPTSDAKVELELFTLPEHPTLPQNCAGFVFVNLYVSV
jgi:hypothetical protein